MSWTIARLGSRFSLFFDPYRRRVMHSALGRFLDRPMDLMVGLIEPDGTERTLPFTTRGTTLYNPEQFERFNSITFRGFSERYRLRFEFNVHSVFYPQDEELCLMPAFYLEMRVSPTERLRDTTPVGPAPEKVRLFLRLNRPETQITASAQGGGRIDLAYRNPLCPSADDATACRAPQDEHRSVEVRERIISLNANNPCTPDGDGKGLSVELPVTEVGSGIKWRLVWGAFCNEPVLDVHAEGAEKVGRFRYLTYWDTLDAVMDDAVQHRDDRLALSRRIEKIVEQAPLRNAERHLINQSFQAFLANTFWCDLGSLDAQAAGDAGDHAEPDSQAATEAAAGLFEWFSVWEGNGFLHSTLDVEYNSSLLYLSIWPRLLALQLGQWARFIRPHEASGGAYLHHDLGLGMKIAGQAYSCDMPVEENANYLLMMQAYAHATGDVAIVRRHADLLGRLARYLIWTDRDHGGLPTEGAANTLVDALPALHTGQRQTYLAVKRLAALNAAADLLSHAGRDELAAVCEDTVEGDTPKVEAACWLGEHYAVCAPAPREEVVDAWESESLPTEETRGADAYSIHTANGLLLPMLTGQPLLMDPQRLLTDIVSATRETMTAYGCSHTSADPDHIWISQNLWRDSVARYLGVYSLSWTPTYWDLQVLSNSGGLSLGYCDTYISNNLCFYPRGIASIGLLLSYPRLVIDRLAPGGARISVDPDRHYPQRWPLLPLADWKAGKIPICVVNTSGRVAIEGESDPIIVRGETATSGVIG